MVRIRVHKRGKKKERKRKEKKDEIGERESQTGKCEVNFDTFARTMTVRHRKENTENCMSLPFQFRQ